MVPILTWVGPNVAHKSRLLAIATKCAPQPCSQHTAGCDNAAVLLAMSSIKSSAIEIVWQHLCRLHTRVPALVGPQSAPPATVSVTGTNACNQMHQTTSIQTKISAPDQIHPKAAAPNETPQAAFCSKPPGDGILTKVSPFARRQEHTPESSNARRNHHNTQSLIPSVRFIAHPLARQ